MLFNSLIFLAFFLGVYSFYLGLHKHRKLQNALLLVSSYVFYGYWDWRFLSLIVISTLTDFLVGRFLGKLSNLTPEGKSKRRYLLLCSVAVNLTLLGFFKYFNFFSESFVEILSLIGLKADPVTLNLVLPIGISFYTFQTMSYTIDIYRNRIRPTKSLLNFAVFVAFFPQLVAGPIERAANLLPQFAEPRRIKAEQINAGLFLILWGYFKKMVVADNCGIIANQIFSNYTNYQGLDIIIGALAFAFQIYGDFSGYSDIARGISRLMGIEIMINFKLPFFAVNPSDFWRRWHISLSSWLRDYLYIPLGGNRRGSFNTYRNLFIVMLLAGLWHGAAWNFVIWGAFHGVILMIHRIIPRSSANPEKRGGLRDLAGTPCKIALTFTLTLIGWIIFRSTSLDQIMHMLTSASVVASTETYDLATKLLFFTAPLLLVEIVQNSTRDLLVLTRLPALAKVPAYTAVLIWIFVFGVRESLEFIYFQF
jgi:D-alanyl-lipoteichoic acid acyltransferase DltB (MBOAT superfamily)